MEFFIGGMIVLIAVFVSNRMLKGKLENYSEDFRIKYSQSHIYNLVAPYFYDLGQIKPKKRQSSQHKKDAYTKVVVADGEAYWITDNKLYTAKMGDSGVDNTTTTEVDTFSLENKELVKIMFIVEKLREDDNLDEDWDSR